MPPARQAHQPAQIPGASRIYPIYRLKRELSETNPIETVKPEQPDLQVSNVTKGSRADAKSALPQTVTLTALQPQQKPSAQPPAPSRTARSVAAG